MKLMEYIAHPLHALRVVANYDRNPEIRKSLARDKRTRDTFRKGYSWIREYFDSLYDFNRVQLYATYKEIDQDPLMASVSDTYAMSCSQVNSDTTGIEAGRVVWCYSNNKELEKLIYRTLSRLEIDELAFPILRGMFQNGDHFEYLPGVAGVGIPHLIPYEPWEVSVIRDGEGKISGYTQSDTKGDPCNLDSVVPFYSFAHFKMPNRQRTEIYGAKSSLFFNIREYWQELQWCWDKVLIERLRRADRTIITLDVGGMSTEDAFFACREWQDRLYQNLYVNPSSGEMQTSPPAWGEQRDIVIPSNGDNRTQFSHTSASNVASLDDAKMLLSRLFAALRFPASYLGLDMGERFDKGASLGKQDVAFAANCIKPQRTFLTTLSKIISYDLAWQNVDMSSPKNSFILMMSPVSNYQEVEKKEITLLRFDLLSSALRLGKDNEWNQEYWTQYVMKEYGHFSPEMTSELLKKAPEVPEEENKEASRLPFEAEESDNIELLLEEHPRAKKALEFLKDGNFTAVASKNIDLNEANINLDGVPILGHVNTDYVHNLVVERTKKRQELIEQGLKYGT